MKELSEICVDKGHQQNVDLQLAMFSAIAAFAFVEFSAFAAAVAYAIFAA